LFAGRIRLIGIGAIVTNMTISVRFELFQTLTRGWYTWQRIYTYILRLFSN